MIYKMIKNYDSEEFNKEVNEMLGNDWELYGFPFAPVTSFEEGKYIGSFYAQAFTRESPLPEPEQQQMPQIEENSGDIPF